VTCEFQNLRPPQPDLCVLVHRISPPHAATNGQEDRDDAVAQGGIERPCSPGDGGGCGFKCCQPHQRSVCESLRQARHLFELQYQPQRDRGHKPRAAMILVVKNAGQKIPVSCCFFALFLDHGKHLY
jgi:hypothetical protein